MKINILGKHKDLLLYLTPIIFENNPAINCIHKGGEKIRQRIPARRKMDAESCYGMAIGNLTSQAASNLNLSEFDNYVVKELKLKNYVRYVDDIIVVAADKKKLINALPYIIQKLKETNQIVNIKKTKIDTAYHGVSFLGKMSYPYGYQKAKKTTLIRMYHKAETIKFTDEDNLISKVNSQVGTLKKYNCRRLILNYAKKIHGKTKHLITFDKNELKFNKIEH